MNKDEWLVERVAKMETLLEKIHEQTTKTNGRVNNHDGKIGLIEKILFSIVASVLGGLMIVVWNLIQDKLK